MPFFSIYHPNNIGREVQIIQLLVMQQRMYEICRLRRLKNSSALIMLASGQQTCMTYTIAVRTVKNS